MTDHRRVQRTLLRMQLDEGLARAVLEGAPDALASTGLGAEDLALLRALDPAGVAADPGGRRRTQVLGNAASEYALTLARAERGGALPGLLEGFARAPELHDALREERGLPLAFGAYARRRAEAAGRAELLALVQLERGMAAARRAPQDPPEVAPDEVVRGPRAHVLELPGGTLERAAALRAALDGAGPWPGPWTPGPERERALLLAAPRERPHRLPEVQVELLSPAVTGLLELAAEPLGPAARARFARSQGAEPAELEGFVAALVEDGVLWRGPLGTADRTQD